MPNIDKLDIEITASAKKAQNSITGLISSLNNLKQNLTNFSDGKAYVTGLGNIASGLNAISRASQSVNTDGLKALNNSISKLVANSEAINSLNFKSLTGIHITADQFSGITVLANSFGKLAGINADSAAVNLPRIASGLASLSGIHLPDNATQLAALGQALGAFGSKAATRAQGLPQLVEGLRQLQYIKVPKLEGFSELASGLGKLGGAKVEAAIKNMPKLAVAFNQLMATLSKSPKVSRETIELANAMGQLATATKSTGQATQQSSTGIKLLRGAINSILPSFKKAQHHTFSLAAAFGKIYASYFLLFRAFRKFGEAIDYSSKLTEVQNVVNHTFGESIDKLETFADESIEKYGMAELSAKQFASRFQAMGVAMGVTSDQVIAANDNIAKHLEGNKDAYEDLGDSMADVSINLTKLTADYASFFNIDQEDVAQDMTAILTGMTKPMRDYGLDLTNATLQEWAFKNGLDANIKSMSQAEKTMLRYQYVMANSAHIMGDFARTADTWANVVRTIGQQFQKLGQIIGGGLINLFKPVLIRFRSFMNTLIDLVEKGVNAIGKLLGWQIEIEEVGIAMDDTMSDYADDLGTAVDNAKKLNAQLRSIDELNNLTSPKDSDNGGGGSGVSGAGGGQSKVSGGGLQFKDYESDIESWFDLGDRIKQKIIDGIKSINWNEISNKVKENAKGFVDMLKGLLFPDKDGNTLGGAIGEFLAESINLGFDWLVTSTGDMTLWGAAGNNIADFFLKFFEHLDVEDMAETINNIVEGLKTMITTATEKLNTPENRKMIAEKIADFFKSIKPETWRTVMKGLEIYLGVVTIKNISKFLIGTVLKDKIQTALVDKLATEGVTATALQGIGLAISISLLIDDITVTEEAAEQIKESTDAYDPFSGETAKTPKQWWQGIKEQGWEGALRMLKELGKIAMFLPDSQTALNLKNNFGATDIDLLKELAELPEYTNEEEWREYIDTLDDICDRYGMTRDELRKLMDTMENAADSPKKNDFLEFLKLPWSLSWELDEMAAEARQTIDYERTGHSGGGGGASFGEAGEADGKEYIEGVDRGITQKSNEINWGGFVYEIKAEWLSFGDWWETTGIYNWWTNDVAPWFTREKWQELGNNIKLGISDKWNELVLWWHGTGFYKWWTEDVQPWFTKERWTTLGDNIKKGLTEKWTEFQNWWDNTGLKKWIDDTTEKFNRLRDDITGENGLFARMQAKASEVWGAIQDIFNQGFTIKLPHISWDTSNMYTVTGLLGDALEKLGLPTSIPQLKVEWYADGGFPTPGSLFVAGEAGAELLGTMNGRTTVASNGEITGISDTIRSTSAEEIQLLRQQNQLLQGILQKEFGISNGDIFRSVRTSAAEYTKMTGNPAF